MPIIECQHTDCIYCNIAGGFECKAAVITIGEEWDEGCSGYEDYRDQPDYQNEYWITVETKSGEAAKAKVYRGKRIEHEGRVFYAKDRTDIPDYCYLTDAETGFGAGTLLNLLDHFAQICVQAQKHPKVETLPEAEWVSGGYKLVKEKHHENG